MLGIRPSEIEYHDSLCSNHNKKWTFKEDIKLVRLKQTEIKGKQIAYEMNRSYGSIQGRFSKIKRDTSYMDKIQKLLEHPENILYCPKSGDELTTCSCKICVGRREYIHKKLKTKENIDDFTKIYHKYLKSGGDEKSWRSQKTVYESHYDHFIEWLDAVEHIPDSFEGEDDYPTIPMKYQEMFGRCEYVGGYLWRTKCCNYCLACEEKCGKDLTRISHNNSKCNFKECRDYYSKCLEPQATCKNCISGFPGGKKLINLCEDCYRSIDIILPDLSDGHKSYFDGPGMKKLGVGMRRNPHCYIRTHLNCKYILDDRDIDYADDYGCEIKNSNYGKYFTPSEFIKKWEQI